MLHRESRPRETDKKRAVPVTSREGDRADRVVARVLGVGRRRARELIDSGAVLVDGRRTRSGEKVGPTAEITALEPVVYPTVEAVPLPEQPRIVWQQGHIIAVNKPAGYHSHRGKQRPSIADFLARLYPGIDAVGDSPVECGVVHRLDRDTSGILVAASDRAVFASLRRAFGEGEVSKDYLALVHGVVLSDRVVDVPLTRLHSRVRAARRSERSWPARTLVVPLERGAWWTLVRATMETGVTHQVRAHLAILGHPVIGDRKYGDGTSGRDLAGGQRLHASCIRLPGGLTLAAAPGGRFLETLAELRRETEVASR
jgi:23S rRNA pseudouridine1911/1915/1917 synthase